MGMVQNPILSGFYPDPSVCGVIKRADNGAVIDADYYLVNSSFAYVPGVPIFHSKDLESWTQLGHVLERREQLELTGAGISEGIYAPTIRFHKGLFYMISTNVSGKGNFYVTAENPKGPWSEPVYLEDAMGFDPSLYFEGDTCYYVGQRTREGAEYFGDCEIWLQELDLEKKRLTGQVSVLWNGAMKHAIWPEGPHLYHKGEYYYLLIAEGGTEYSHSICVARSKKLTGPYEPCPNNPIFTHRQLGEGALFQNVGHGDMVETASGNWYIVMLGTRPIEGCAPLGRETFLAEVQWENDWPVINPGEGKLRPFQRVEAGKPAQNVPKAAVEKGSVAWSDPLDMRCLFFRHPQSGMYQLQKEARGNRLALRVGTGSFGQKEAPAYVGIRVTKPDFSVRTSMEYTPKQMEEAGLVYLYDEENHVKLVLCQDQNGKEEWQVRVTEKGSEKLLQKTEAAVEKKIHVIELSLAGLLLTCKADGCVIAKTDVRMLTSKMAGGFVGCTMGVYAGRSHEKADSFACFSELVLG